MTKKVTNEEREGASIVLYESKLLVMILNGSNACLMH